MEFADIKKFFDTEDLEDGTPLVVLLDDGTELEITGISYDDDEETVFLSTGDED